MTNGDFMPSRPAGHGTGSLEPGIGLSAGSGQGNRELGAGNRAFHGVAEGEAGEVGLSGQASSEPGNREPAAGGSKTWFPVPRSWCPASPGVALWIASPERGVGRNWVEYNMARPEEGVPRTSRRPACPARPEACPALGTCQRPIRRNPRAETVRAWNRHQPQERFLSPLPPRS